MNIQEVGKLAIDAFYLALYETGLSYKYEKETIGGNNYGTETD